MRPSVPSWLYVSRETLDKLEEYVVLLKKWNEKINLVSRETIDNIWDRHIWDSAQIADYIPPQSHSIVDLGSGAGLPGIVLSCLLNTPITLVERDQRKTAFLSEIIRKLELFHVKVVNNDIKNLHQKFDVVTARALASLSELCHMAHPLLGVNAICLFPKGKNFATEISEAKKHWNFEFHAIQSKTNPEAHVITLSELKINTHS